jgi:O-antigen/teichoic acid export membrane protein
MISIINEKKFRQAGVLYVSMFLSMIIGLGITVINTRLLGSQAYGDLKFLQNLYGLVVLFSTLGLFVSGSRLLALKRHQDIRNQLIGNLVSSATVISLVLIIFFYVFSFFEEAIFSNDLGVIIRIFSPLVFVFPFQFCLENIMQGDNRIYELAVFRLSSKALYILFAITLNCFVPLSLISALGIHLLCLAIMVLIMIVRLKPKFVGRKKYGSIVWAENRTYGFHVYVGILANVATAQLAGLSIGYLIDNTNVGFFALANAISMPLAMIPTVVGTTFFKDFANRKTVPQRETSVTFLISVCALLFFILVIERLILYLYSPEYSPVIQLVYFVSVGGVLRGMGDYFNRFLGAHGRGKEIRNAALINGLINVLGYTCLVYVFGIVGAAVTKVLADLCYGFMMYAYCRKFREKTKILQPETNAEHIVAFSSTRF